MNHKEMILALEDAKGLGGDTAIELMDRVIEALESEEVVAEGIRFASTLNPFALSEVEGGHYKRRVRVRILAAKERDGG